MIAMVALVGVGVVLGVADAAFDRLMRLPCGRRAMGRAMQHVKWR